MAATTTTSLQNNLGGVRSLTATLSATIDTEFSFLRSQWEDYETKREALENMKAPIDAEPDTSSRSRLKLNVGGERFEIRCSCIKGYSYFRALYSQTFAAVDSDRFFFIDRDPESFANIMVYLRTRTIDLSLLHKDDRDQLKEEAEFFLMSDLVEHIEQYEASILPPPPAAVHEMNNTNNTATTSEN